MRYRKYVIVVHPSKSLGEKREFKGSGHEMAAMIVNRDLPIMLIILPIMLSCTSQYFAYYA